MYKFFGFTAIDILFLDFPGTLFKECVEYYNKDKATLFLLKEQFERLDEFLDNPMLTSYSSLDDKKKYTELIKTRKLLKKETDRTVIQSLENKIKIIEEELSKRPKAVVSRLPVNGRTVDFSPVTIRIIEILLSKKQRIKLYLENLQIDSIEMATKTYFDAEIYQLGTFELSRLMYRFERKFNEMKNSKEGIWNYVGSFCEDVNSKIDENVGDDSAVKSVNRTKKFLEEKFDNYIREIDYDEFIIKLTKDDEEVITLDDLHNSSIELASVGAVGFTPYVQDLYEQFKKNYVASYTTDIKVSEQSSLAMFTRLLERAKDSNRVFGEKI